MPRPPFSAALAVAALATAVGCFRTPPPPKPVAATADRPRPTALPRGTPDAKVRLAVVVVFDQMRGDYLARWKDHFGPDGFNRLMGDGAWFANCHYPYATTTTGPGHASILTGCSAERHGIINNDWFDRKTGKKVYCAGDPRIESVPVPPKKPSYGGSPHRLLARTVADELKDATGGAGKVVGLSLKDRGAILPTGAAPGAEFAPDAVYWFDDRLGTSTYYREAVHPWAAGFNQSKYADHFFGRPWERLRPDLDYAKLVGPDDVTGEGGGTKQGRTFPHPTDGGLKAPGPAYYAAVESSPYGTDLLLEVAKRAIEGEGLGADDVPDLLTVSFSSNDLIGHSWGPDSQEVFDITLRSDAVMAALLKYLDEKVGAGRYSVVLTADHGVCPTPEVAVTKGLPAGRIDVKPMLAGLEAHLRKTFAPTASASFRFVEADALPHLYLNRASLKSRKLDENTVADAAAGWLKSQPGIAAVYTRAGLMAGVPKDDTIGAMVRKCYHPDRAGELYLVVKPYWLFGNYKTGTTHGSPHPYDTHVPLLVYGPGTAGGKRDDAVTPQHAAPFTAAFLGVPVPDKCEYQLPKSPAKK